MKTCRYLVEIEMPDGDMVSANWLKDIIQHDCEYEDKERQKVSVREFDLPEEFSNPKNTCELLQWIKETKTPMSLVSAIFQAGKEWAFKQGETFNAHKGAFGICFDGSIDAFLDNLKVNEKVIVQIRKAE